METIRIAEKILGKNNELADGNRHRFEAAGVFVVSLVGSAGGGKTSLLERVIPRLANELRVGVIEGDVETERDGRRIEALHVPVSQVVTGGTCHLNAGMIEKAAATMTLADIDLLFIENVGNLICPAAYSLGEHMRVVVMSTTEGEDKPLKYPAMFRQADAMVLNKIDLLPHLPLNVCELEEFARRVQPELQIFRTSAQTNEGIEAWTKWLLDRRASWYPANWTNLFNCSSAVAMK
jgi:hydrogenase nickel incorporation protein HypB